MSVDMSALKLMVDQAIPAGLIVSELISNAIKYAFPGQRPGSILIEGRHRGDQIELAIRDDGVGIAARPEPKGRESRGLQIVTILCGQLNATLEQTHEERETGPGAVFHISFPDKAFSGETALAP